MANQTRPPDELIVCDDRSSDRTIGIVREFAASATYPVRIFENESNLGSAANFERAIRLCEGNLIALSDQDDIWYPTRLQRSEQEFTAHPEAGLVFSDADVINDENELTGATMWQRTRLRGQTRARSAGRSVLPFGEAQVCDRGHRDVPCELTRSYFAHRPGWIHDEWIALVTAAFSDLRPIHQPLIRYRIHGSQQVGFQNKLEQRDARNSGPEALGSPGRVGQRSPIGVCGLSGNGSG